MPYRWTETENEATLILWPHQSLTREGFAWFIVPTAVLFCLPLLAVIGSPVAWVLLGFFCLALWAIWRAIMLNKASRSSTETLVLGDDTLRLLHRPSSGKVLTWETNPYWVQVDLRDDGPVENYLTLSGKGREVELGSFLTPEERQALFRELRQRLRR